MPQECLICFDPILGATWKPPNKCECKQIVHKECWEKWSKMDGSRSRCIICREELLLVLYRPVIQQRNMQMQPYGLMGRVQHGIHREIRDIEGPRGEHRPCLKTFFIFFSTVMIYTIVKILFRYMGAHTVFQLPDQDPFRFRLRDEL